MGSDGIHSTVREALGDHWWYSDEEEPLPYLLIRQKFVDYAQWRRAYDDMADTRAQFGLRTVALTRNKADLNEIVVLFEFDDPARVKEYIQGPGLAAAWRRGGVVPDTNQATFLEAAGDVDG